MSAISIGPATLDDGGCSVGRCARPAIRCLRVSGGAITTILRFCLGHLRELRDVVDEKIG